MEKPAKITVARRVEWSDTDAAGVFHWNTAFRMVEAAEALLHERLGVRERTFGATPRVHVEASFNREFRFFDRVEVELSVASVGRTSLRYAFALRPYDEEGPTTEPDEAGEPASKPAVHGELVIAHVTGQPAGSPTPWPPDLRARFEEGGDQGVAEAP